VIGSYFLPAGANRARSFIARNNVATQVRNSEGNLTLLAINASGQVLAQMHIFPTAVQRTVIWKDGVTEEVGIRGFGFNNKGHVVGSLDLCCDQRVAALWMDGVAYDLQSRVVSVGEETNCAELNLESAVSINGKGQIAAEGWCDIVGGGFKYIGVLLTPIQ
jgi:hypothetical protein